MAKLSIIANFKISDTGEYQLIIKSYIEAIRACGVAISLLGGLGILISGYALYNNINEQI